MPGHQGGEALANILFGDVNPQAKLPATFPRSDADLPHPAIFGSDQRPTPPVTPPTGTPTAPPQRFQMKPFDIDYTEGLKVGYKWFQAEAKKPLFAFGHGLSYTSFAYSDLTATLDSVSFKVRNTGKRAGAEIAQVYAGLPASASEPPKRLVAWEKVVLSPGEAKMVTLKLDPKFLSIFNEEKGHEQRTRRRDVVLEPECDREVKNSDAFHRATTSDLVVAPLDAPGRGAESLGGIQNCGRRSTEQLIPKIRARCRSDRRAGAAGVERNAVDVEGFERGHA